jgi:hypothetical protein
MADIELAEESLSKNIELRCTGHDLRGCPDKAKAIWETKSNETWKRGRGARWVFVCDKCAQKLNGK